MAVSPCLLPVIPLPGLRLEVLGNYLASLGLLRLLARRWPGVRIAWREGVLHVLGGPENLDELVDVVVDIANQRAWTPYERTWLGAQKASTKQETGRPLAVWQGRAEEAALELFLAHDVALDRVAFNPLLGSGGNAGQRDFSKGWKAVVDVLKHDAKKGDRRAELRAFLLGEPLQWLIEGVAAASWFSNANKLYNSGQSAYREEPVSPWAMALACEGLPFFAGGASRRLGANARAQAAFPFVCQAAAPTTPGEAGRDRGEVWVPIWERPMALPEVRALFQRGRAEVRGRGANTPAAFAAAIVRRGVDAGLAGFVRFALGATTSANTFEPRHQGLIHLPSRRGDSTIERARAEVAERTLALVERLPKDRKESNNWRFVGLRGPIEAALIRMAQEPDSALAIGELLDAIVSVLDRVDRNVAHRQALVRWQPLPLEALPLLFRGSTPGLEERLAMGLVSAFPATRPFTLYRFGVEQRFGSFEHPERVPARWVFRSGSLAKLLTEVLLRFALDWQNAAVLPGLADGGPLRADPLPVSADDLGRWLHGAVDEFALARWLGRLALFDWRKVPSGLRASWQPELRGTRYADGSLLLCGLFQPLFDSRPLKLPAGWGQKHASLEESGARTPGAARAIAQLIRTGAVDGAVKVARMRYAMADVPLVHAHAHWQVAEPERLLAGILFPLSDLDRRSLIERWLRPQRRNEEKGGYDYV